jgi:hypothetical protein
MYPSPIMGGGQGVVYKLDVYGQETVYIASRGRRMGALPRRG